MGSIPNHNSVDFLLKACLESAQESAIFLASLCRETDFLTQISFLGFPSHSLMLMVILDSILFFYLLFLIIFLFIIISFDSLFKVELLGFYQNFGHSISHYDNPLPKPAKRKLEIKLFLYSNFNFPLHVI